jgi:tRNA(fMet)-specific endonuclease VapC
MNYMLDTSVCVDHMRRPDSPMHGWLDAVDADSVRLCSVVRAELLVGLRKKPTEWNRRRVMGFLAAFECYPFDNAAAEVYADIRAELESQGKVIGPYDMMIAAVAKARGLTLVTGNPEEFGRVPGLAVLPLEGLAAGKTPP